MALLELHDISVHYQKVPAVKQLSLELEDQQMITIIGSNGAGKSSTLRAITGLIRPSQGDILYKGQSIKGLSPDKILKNGIAHVPEGRRIFLQLSVQENLFLGAFTRSDKKAVLKDMDKVFDHFPKLYERKKQLACTMSGGELQMLSIARALMSDPELLILDEPSLGLAPVIVNNIADILVDIHKRGVSIILVEQNAEMALDLAEYAYVLELGQVTLHGESSKLRDNEHVRMAYLGI